MADTVDRNVSPKSVVVDSRVTDADEQDASEPETSHLKLEFTGSAAEYFRIWIVNTCLTLFTLGVFSAWAKVRKQRYLYAHTILDGTPFEYLGRPLPILKGRLIAVVSVGAWFLVKRFHPESMPLVLLFAVLLAPWIVVKSAAFRANATAYRNIRFAFSGSIRQAVNSIYAGLFVTFLTAGIGYGWLEYRIRRYLLYHTRYGQTYAEFEVDGSRFVMLNVKAWFVALVASVLLVILMTGPQSHPVVVMGLPSLTMLLYYTYKQARTFNICWRNTTFGGVFFRPQLTFRGLLVLYLTNGLAIVASLGLLIPWAMLRTVRYRIERTSVYVEGSLQELEGSDSPGSASSAEVLDPLDLDIAF